jgi:hypothetical protein
MHFAVKVGLHTFFSVVSVSLRFLNGESIESIVKVITIKLFGLYNCGSIFQSTQVDSVFLPAFKQFAADD